MKNKYFSKNEIGVFIVLLVLSIEVLYWILSWFLGLNSDPTALFRLTQLVLGVGFLLSFIPLGVVIKLDEKIRKKLFK